MNTVISVLIPAYNVAHLIGACLQSLANQSFSDFEIVIIDDGSTDSTEQTVRTFISEHPELSLRLITQKNMGVSAARKTALENARGRWVTFVDADDTLPIDALTILYKQVSGDTDLVVGFLSPPKDRSINLSTTEQWQHAVLDGLIPPSVGGKLYRRSVLQPWMLAIPRNITNGEDALMNIAYVFSMSKSPKFVYSTIYNYRRNNLSLSHTTNRTIQYEYEYDRLRYSFIPAHLASKHLRSITKSRLNGVLGCYRSDMDAILKKEHPFFQIIEEGIQQCNYQPNLYERVILNSKSPFFISLCCTMRDVFHSLAYRLSLLHIKH